MSAAPTLLVKQHGVERATISGGGDQEPRYLEVASSNLHTTTTAGAGDGIGNGGGGSDGGSDGGSGDGGSGDGGSDGGGSVSESLLSTLPASEGGL